jgi:autotransporter-associated beta strand protein
VIGSTATWTSALAMTLTGTNGNVTFDTSGSFSNVLTGALTGPGGLTKIGTGTLLLTSNNTFSGGTIITQGIVFVRGTHGGGSNVVVSGGTLGGDGLITDPVIVGTGGTLSPGYLLGKLTVNNSVSLSGNTVMQISKLGTTFTNDIVVANSIQFGGTLTVTASGDALAAGDSFDLFDAGSSSGSFGTFALPSLGSGLAWDTSQVAANGTIRVVSGGGPQLSISLAGGTISLSWPSAPGYLLQAQTNGLGTGITTNWITLTNITTNFVTFPRDTISGSVFYRLTGP